MRKAKFRGKRIDNGEWGYANHYGTGRESFERFWMDVADDLIDPNTVGQSTGLKDKNGKEIYEGDILFPNNQIVKFGEFQNSFEQGCGWFTQIENYNKTLFQESKGWPWSFYKFKVETTKVIGNIHENPESMETKNE